MTRAGAIAAVLARLGDEPVVAANGFLGREAFGAADRAENFYMIGSMGLAASIGLGLALVRPERRVVVIDGDGNLLMGLGALPMVAERAPARFLHVVLDNQAYASTGGQRSIADAVDLAAIARGAGYPHVRRVDDGAGLSSALDDLLAAEGPAFLLVKVDPVDPSAPAPRVSHPPERIAARFRAALGVEEAA
jgi:thiamine pyrophosphate-dependent acetolactate synthase large subunit-like protein